MIALILHRVKFNASVKLQDAKQFPEEGYI
jgi:hypothetical protein